jgi:outer membrane immunogenic protein
MKATLLAVTALSLLSASALAADLGVPFKPPPGPAPFAWTGCYAGANAGGGWGQKDLTDSAGFLAGLGGPSSASLDIDGYMLGGQLGCDYQFASGWVLGVEGYAAGGKIGGNALVPVPGDNATFSDTTNLLTSGTARIGYAYGGWLPYVKAGVAWASDNYTVGDVLGFYNATASEDRFGWTVGAGIEWALWHDWSVKLEYDYYGFGRQSVTFTDSVSGATGPVDIKQNIQVVKLGLNFHVWAGPGSPLAW